MATVPHVKTGRHCDTFEISRLNACDIIVFEMFSAVSIAVSTFDMDISW